MIVLVPIPCLRHSTTQYYRNLGSLRYGNEYCAPGRAMSCSHQLLPSKKSEMRRRSGRLYSQRPRPFWQTMVGYIAIGSLNAAVEPLVRFYSTARTNRRAVTLCDYKRLQLKRKKRSFSHTASSTQ